MKSFPESILCATDFSDHATTALRWASYFSNLFQTPLHLFHAIHFPQDQIHASDLIGKSSKIKRLESEARKKMEHYEWLAENSAAIHSLIRFGDPVETLTDHLKKMSSALVVSGRRGFTALQRAVMGSVIERLSRNLPCPLLVVPGDAVIPPAINRIGVCCSSPKGRSPVLTTAVLLARVTGAAIHVLHVLGAPPQTPSSVEASLSYESAQEKAEQRLHRQLSVSLTDHGLDPNRVVPAIRHGNTGEQILSFLADNPVDLFVVGVRRRTRLGKLLVGSTTEALLRHCRSPVMTVPVVPNKQIRRTRNEDTHERSL